MNDGINLTGVLPADEDVPLNVLIQLQGTAAAYVRATETRQAYDAIPKPAPLQEPEPERLSLESPVVLAPISAGRRIEPDPNKYVTDTGIRTRLSPHRQG